jgi:hypothetical protein
MDEKELNVKFAELELNRAAVGAAASKIAFEEGVKKIHARATVQISEKDKNFE